MPRSLPNSDQLSLIPGSSRGHHSSFHVADGQYMSFDRPDSARASGERLPHEPPVCPRVAQCCPPSPSSCLCPCPCPYLGDCFGTNRADDQTLRVNLSLQVNLGFAWAGCISGRLCDWACLVNALVEKGAARCCLHVPLICHDATLNNPGHEITPTALASLALQKGL